MPRLRQHLPPRLQMRRPLSQHPHRTTPTAPSGSSADSRKRLPRGPFSVPIRSSSSAATLADAPVSPTSPSASSGGSSSSPSATLHPPHLNPFLPI
ncbi:hypothetical protein L596_011421 [Steinernema carpocapsae]|uniref:Uncharacterized protein n=1 Tax=Steinernema carpocapsae TaxID=34508 RepID=A0A4V6A4G8_STECR|nr:hypothetical protein L596_011421 [Steinernema carpocapsae]